LAKEKFDMDKSYHFSFDFFLPKNFPIIDDRLIIGQWKQSGKE
jgi:hypothetical protein